MLGLRASGAPLRARCAGQLLHRRHAPQSTSSARWRGGRWRAQLLRGLGLGSRLRGGAAARDRAVETPAACVELVVHWDAALRARAHVAVHATVTAAAAAAQRCAAIPAHNCQQLAVRTEHAEAIGALCRPALHAKTICLAEATAAMLEACLVQVGVVLQSLARDTAPQVPVLAPDGRLHGFHFGVGLWLHSALGDAHGGLPVLATPGWAREEVR
mmetsp:Transcript_93194/g.240834  ORF Transcript_93194/g.240834 Transcript_93194/m.240834 type:complete len:215 (+) Transcript_93194:667-1311(+)